MERLITGAVVMIFYLGIASYAAYRLSRIQTKGRTVTWTVFKYLGWVAVVFGAILVLIGIVNR